MFGPPQTRLALEIALPPSQVRERLAGSMDRVRSVLFTPTWGLRGRVVGWVEGERFCARVRHGYSNGLTRIAYGRLAASRAGTLVAVEFRTLGAVVALLRAVAIGVVALTVPAVLEVSRSGASGRVVTLSLLAPTIVLGFLMLVEAVARGMGRDDERILREHFEELFRNVARGIDLDDERDVRDHVEEMFR